MTHLSGQYAQGPLLTPEPRLLLAQKTKNLGINAHALSSFTAEIPKNHHNSTTHQH
jgi:hypothetical protein